MGFGHIESHANKIKKHKFHQKNFLDHQSVFVTASTKDNDANSSSSLSTAPVVSLKLPQKNIQWIPSTLNEKIMKGEGFILLTAIKCNYSFSFISIMEKIMPVAFND